MMASNNYMLIIYTRISDNSQVRNNYFLNNYDAIWFFSPRKSPDIEGRLPGRVAQSVGHLTRNSEVLGSIPGLATYFRLSFCWFKKGSC